MSESAEHHDESHSGKKYVKIWGVLLVLLVIPAPLILYGLYCLVFTHAPIWGLLNLGVGAAIGGATLLYRYVFTSSVMVE